MILKERLYYYYLILRKKFFPKKKIITGSCNKCGECCKNITLYFQGSVLKDLDEFKLIIETIPEYAIFKFVKQASTGELIFTCEKLGDDNLCMDYDNRENICKRYPDKSSIRVDKNKLKKCGFNLETVLDFKDMLKIEMFKK